jgi:Phage capsid protein
MAVMQIDNALITQFSALVHVKAQQMRARLRPYIQVIPIHGENLAYDGIGDIEAQEVLGRVQPTVFSDINHLRRKLSRRRFSITLPVDSMDVAAVLLNVDGQYVSACVRAMERVFDRLVIEALGANVWTGKAMDTEVTAAADGVSTVTATSGLTYEKLLEIRQNFMDNEVGNDTPEQILMTVTGDEHTALMKETELISGDFTRNLVVDQGQIVSAVGMKIIPFAASARSPIIPVASSVRTNYAFSTRAVVVGMSKEMEISIDKRPDLIQTHQIQINWILGAVRTEGVLVQKVTTAE